MFADPPNSFRRSDKNDLDAAIAKSAWNSTTDDSIVLQLVINDIRAPRLSKSAGLKMLGRLSAFNPVVGPLLSLASVPLWGTFLPEQFFSLQRE